MPAAAERCLDLRFDRRRFQQHEDYREENKKYVREYVFQPVQDAGSQSHGPARIDHVAQALQGLVAIQRLGNEFKNPLDDDIEPLLVARQGRRKFGNRGADDRTDEEQHQHHRGYDNQCAEDRRYPVALHPEHRPYRDQSQKCGDQKRHEDDFGHLQAVDNDDHGGERDYRTAPALDAVAQPCSTCCIAPAHDRISPLLKHVSDKVLLS